MNLRTRGAAVTALSLSLIAAAVPAYAQSALAHDENPGMARMHERMMSGQNPGMARMHERMMSGENPGMGGARGECAGSLDGSESASAASAKEA